MPKPKLLAHNDFLELSSWDGIDSKEWIEIKLFEDEYGHEILAIDNNFDSIHLSLEAWERLSRYILELVTDPEQMKYFMEHYKVKDANETKN